MRGNTICGEIKFVPSRRRTAVSSTSFGTLNTMKDNKLTTISIQECCRERYRELLWVGWSGSTITHRVHLPGAWALYRDNEGRHRPTLSLSFVSILGPHKRHFQTTFFLLYKRSYQTLRCHLCNSKHRDRASTRSVSPVMSLAL